MLGLVAEFDRDSHSLVTYSAACILICLVKNWLPIFIYIGVHTGFYQETTRYVFIDVSAQIQVCCMEKAIKSATNQLPAIDSKELNRNK